MIVIGIVGAEIAFWVVLVLALLARYVLKWRRTSAGLLLLLPVLDAALLTFVIIDLLNGAEPGPSHALAGSYLGFTVAFGHPLIRWVDGKFATWFAGAPPLEKPRKGSDAYVRAAWSEWYRVVVAVAISLVILAFLALVITHEPLPTSFETIAASPFWSQAVILLLLVVVWFLAGPAFTRRSAQESPASQEHPADPEGSVRR